MDAFEDIVASLFSHNGFWVRQGYKVNLTKEEKAEIGKPTMPRLEIDLLAYSPGGNAHGETPTYSNFLVEENTLLWVECKSYLDSPGVKFHLGNVADGADPQILSFKMLNNELYRDIISRRLLKQVVEEGLTLPNPRLQYCLVAGHTYSKTREELHEYFERRHWKLLDEYAIKSQLQSLSQKPYENDIVMLMSKLFERLNE